MSEETLLLVDDEQDVIDALARTLRNGGYRMLEATSGTAALDIVQREQVDLLLTDIDMPDMTGLDLLTKVRATHPQIVRFILTGVASLDSALVAINEGAVHRYLTKPWDTEGLRSAIRDGLGRRAQNPATAPAVAAGLSPRVQQTLERLMRGACPKEIAVDLGISVHTTRQYVKTLYRHFDVSTRAELIAKLHGLR
jgi:FixJ family two-component response regulator